MDGPGSKADGRKRLFSSPKRPECLMPNHISTQAVPGFFREIKLPGFEGYSHPAIPPLPIHTFMARTGKTNLYQERVTTKMDNVQIQNSRSWPIRGTCPVRDTDQPEVLASSSRKIPDSVSIRPRPLPSTTCPIHSTIANGFGSLTKPMSVILFHCYFSRTPHGSSACDQKLA